MREFLREQRSGWARRVTLQPTAPDRPWRTPDSDTVLDVRAALAGIAPRQRALLDAQVNSDGTDTITYRESGP